MKKSIIALTIMSFAALMLSSCANEQEININDGNLQKGDLALTIKGTQTRSEATASNEFEGETSTLTFTTEEGQELTLDETVVDLNGLATRGTPAYTENVATLYGQFNAIMYNGTTKLHDLGAFKYDSSDPKERWIRHLYVADPFEGVTGDMSIYMWMPTDMTSKGVTIGESAYGTSGNNLTISFAYAGGETVGTAANQEDILFSGLKISASDYDASLETEAGAPSVFFYHALTGVKFAVADGGTEATIEEVIFKGLKDKGTCVVTAGATTDYSSGTAAVWTPDATTPVSDYSMNTGYSSGTYPATLQDFTTKPDGSTLGSTFYGANSGKNNLNDAAATQTFWLMPQVITAGVTITIKYKIGEGASQEWTVNYGELLAANKVEWKAGELRTYFIRVDDVNVMIQDDVETTETPNVELKDREGNAILDPDGKPYTFTAYGGTKSNIVITNTGNTDAFIRAALIGQWLDEEGNPVFGFTDFTAGKTVLVDSWYQDQFVKTETGTHGTFVGLPGYKGGTNPLNKWKLQSDGYYYYTEKVPAGEKVPNNLFTSYTVGTAPAVLVAGEVKNVYFVLEIATQAISAKKADGSDYTWEEAWARTNAEE